MKTKHYSLASSFDCELRRFPDIKTLYFKKGKGFTDYLYFRAESVLYVMLYVVLDDVSFFLEKGYAICKEK